MKKFEVKASLIINFVALILLIFSYENDFQIGVGMSLTFIALGFLFIGEYKTCTNLY